ncbi:MAG: glycosyltransferase family 2 protein [Pseudomonadota bacterium]
MGKADKVSLAMPVYNGEQYIREAIDSILDQDYPEFELIITDNASTDSTQEICRDYAKQDPRVRYFRNEKNLGAAPNYNRGFEHATGAYLKWCAHDDKISKNYVSACVAALEADPTATLAFGRTICIDSDSNEVDGPDVNETPAILDTDAAHRYYRALILGGTCFPIFGVFRTSALERSTLHRSYYGSDRALIAEAALQGRMLRVEEAVFYNREHPERSIRMVDKAARSKWQDTSANAAISRMEHVSQLKHLFEIAGRHRDISSPFSARMQVLKFAASPVQLRRILLDLVRFVSPDLAARFRKLAYGPRNRSA